MNNGIRKIFEKNNGFLRSKELTLRNQWYQLKQMVDNGEAIKLKSGLYCLPDYTVAGQDKEVTQMIPSGVFCLFTAWQHHNLTTHNPTEYHVAIERDSKIVLPDYPPIQLYRWSENFYTLGVVEIERIKVYDLEKSVCDAIRLRNKVGIDTTIEVLKNYVKRRDKNLNKLSRYATQMRVENILQTMIMPLL